MDRKEKIVCFLSGTLFLLTLTLSFGFLYLPEVRWVRRVLFFPGEANPLLWGEERFLPARNTVEGDVRLLIDELILGPTSPQLKLILPREVRVESVVLREGILYLSLSQDLILDEPLIRAGLDEMIQAVGNAVLFNFPQISNLFLFIHGQQPGAKYRQGLRLAFRQLR